jgi:hypothetical protein
VPKQAEPDFSSFGVNISCKYWKLTGKIEGYPVAFPAGSATMYQSRLFRGWYK